MKKLLLAAFIFIFIGIKAQIAPFEIPTGKLTEESISKILEHVKLKGVQQWEIDKLNKLLHTKMTKQQQEVLNGTFGQKNNIPPHVNSSSCTNPGFEDGTTNGWTLTNGDINGVTLPCNSCPTSAGAITNVVSLSSSVTGQCTSGSDDYGNFPVVPPSGGGTYALLLNDANAGGKIEQAQYQFVVNSSSDFFTFQYAAVLQSGGHGASAQPYFSVSVTDLTGGNSLSPGCTDYQASAPASGNLAGWSISSLDPTVYTKPWTTVGIDLSSIIGHTVNINFIVSDCNLGGHFGYCYIDANCSNVFSASNITGICGTSGNNITLTGPPGFASYQWYGPNHPYNIINGATSQTYSIATASAIDTFMVKTVFSAGCVDSFKMVVKPILDINGSSTSSCRGNPNPSGSATVTAGPGDFSYVWNGPSGAMGTFTTTTQNNLSPGTYSVHVVDNTGKCPPKDTTVIVAVINPILQTATTQFCGLTPTLVAPNGFGSTYTWYNNSNTNTGVTTQSNTISNAVNGQHYTVTYLDSASHCEDSLQITLNKTTLSFATQVQNPCAGGNNGSLTYNNTTSPNLYPVYNWAISGGTTANGTVTATSVVNLSSLSSGTYTMVISAPGNATCCDTLHSVLSSTANIVPTLISLSPNCNMDTVKITPSVPNVTHSWSGTSTSGTSVTYPYTSSTLIVLPTFSNTVSGYYNYTDSMKSIPGNCLSVTKYTVVLKSFHGSLTALEKLTCHNDSTGKIRASVTSEVNGPINTPDKYTFTWSPSTLTTTTATGSPCSSTKNNLKSNVYICTISNGNCINTYTYNLTNPAPLTNDSIYAYYCPKDSLALVIADTGNTNYVWHPNTAVVSVTGDSAHILVQDVSKCYVTYKHNGCPDTGKVVISVTTYDAFRPDELVNVFTPNGDTKNDYFFPFYSKALNQYQIFKQSDSYEINIYDRWGKHVYNGTDYNKPWDGKTKGGHDADNGTYFFIVKYKSNCGSKADLVEKKGFFELLR